jgi:hypothetical protein
LFPCRRSRHGRIGIGRHGRSSRHQPRRARKPALMPDAMNLNKDM